MATGISTSEAGNSDNKYVPPWTYNPSRKGTKTKEQAMAELKEVVTRLRPEGWEPKLIKEQPDYLYLEYRSPTFGFVDDVEFFLSGRGSEVEYRSASRSRTLDEKSNRKRIKAIRKELETKGWRSVGF